MVYDNLRSFRHDYINVMSSLAAYIDEEKYEELETFFYEHILPMQKNLTQKNGALNNLLHIHLLELKSILYTKLLLAVNRPYGKSDYIPCIAWGRNARYASGFEVGVRVQVWGRVQSREYTKKISDSECEKRVAYEVSVSKLEYGE